MDYNRTRTETTKVLHTAIFGKIWREKCGIQLYYVLGATSLARLISILPRGFLSKYEREYMIKMSFILCTRQPPCRKIPQGCFLASVPPKEGASHCQVRFPQWGLSKNWVPCFLFRKVSKFIGYDRANNGVEMIIHHVLYCISSIISNNNKKHILVIATHSIFHYCIVILLYYTVITS
jgi:hypothetical protein